MSGKADPRPRATIGEIERNGTTVNLTYLTTHPSYNQRMIIVNRSGQPVTYTLGELVAEDGIEVTAMDGAEGSVAAGEKAVIRVATMLMFQAGNLTRRRRAAGTLALNGPVDKICGGYHPGQQHGRQYGHGAVRKLRSEQLGQVIHIDSLQSSCGGRAQALPRFFCRPGMARSAA